MPPLFSHTNISGPPLSLLPLVSQSMLLPVPSLLVDSVGNFFGTDLGKSSAPFFSLIQKVSRRVLNSLYRAGNLFSTATLSTLFHSFNVSLLGFPRHLVLPVLSHVGLPKSLSPCVLSALWLLFFYHLSLVSFKGLLSSFAFRISFSAVLKLNYHHDIFPRIYPKCCHNHFHLYVKHILPFLIPSLSALLTPYTPPSHNISTSSYCLAWTLSSLGSCPPRTYFHASPFVGTMPSLFHQMSPRDVAVSLPLPLCHHTFSLGFRL